MSELTAWIKRLQMRFRRSSSTRTELTPILANVGWLFSDRVLRLLTAMIIGVWVARYLGPERFGQLGYAIALVSLFASIGTLGLPTIVLRELLRDEQSTPEILGTSALLQLCGAIVALLMAVVVVALLRENDPTWIYIVFVLGLGMIFKAGDAFKYLFEARLQSKYFIIVETTVCFVMAGVKVMLIVSGAPLLAFVWMGTLEVAAATVGLFLMYKFRGGEMQPWTVHPRRAASLLRESWPLVISGLAIVLYMRVDQIMLGEMLGDNAVGLYSAAVKLSEAWHFIPTAIISSIFPVLVKAWKVGDVSVEAKMGTLYRVMFALGLGISLTLSALASPLVHMFYGAAYADAANILVIHSWSGVFVALGLANARWLLLEGKTHIATINTLLGCAVNIVLNWILIPIYGGPGAAWATVVSYGCAAYLFLLIHSSTRMSFIAMSRAFRFWRA